MRRGSRPGSWQSPDPARHGESMAPAAQERTAPDPQPGGSYDTRNCLQVVSSCSRVQRLCRRPSSEQVSDRSFPLFHLSQSNPLRWASIWPWHDDRGHPLHAAFVLTEFKTKERRVSHDRLPDSKKGLCPRGSGVPHGKGQGRLSPEIRWKRPHLPMGGLRPLRRSMIDKEIYIWQRKSSTGGPMEPW